ncbi:MAG: flagellar hook-associated protein FlgK [Campylobacterota bacterium]|nr:flagellar hook-associated protein FlgK [Campylobacterota bacterium]
MPSLFNTLGIGYSGLNAAQAGVSVTSHNIANAETEGYSRQRIVTSTSSPIDGSPGSYGNGVNITEIVRIFDSFTHDRYVDASENKEYSSYMRSTMEELSTYFPDIDGVGVKSDLQNYFNMWQSLADTPDNSAIKMALAEDTKVLAQNISYTSEQVSNLQSGLNDQVKSYVDEVNSIARDIADLNKSIGLAESDGIANANDLRDKRNLLEQSLAKLIGADVFDHPISTNLTVNTNIAEPDGNYVIMVGGFNIVDGATYHPIGIDNDNASGSYELYFERQDKVTFPITDIKDGKIGALMELRGSEFDENGTPTNGVLQDTIRNLDEFAKGLIQSTNNTYAASSTTSMRSNELTVDENNALANYSELGFSTGSFNLVMYDIDGNEVASREIVIDTTTTMNDIETQVALNTDDNNDNNALNDIDDYLAFSYDNIHGIASISFNDTKFEAQGYRFSLVDNTSDGAASGSNFAGATGISRYFDGNDAKSIDLNLAIKDNPSEIRPFQENIPGNNTVALNMVQLQFERFDYALGSGSVNDTVYGYYDTLVTEVGSTTNAMISLDDTYTAQFSAIELEYQSISEVSIDEELTNLIKYQTAYGAASKVITTVDEMLNTLLGIKR